MLRKRLQQLRLNRTYGNYLAVNNELEEAASGKEFLKPLKVAILRNITIETLIPVIKGEIALFGYNPEVYIGEFDAIAAEVMKEGSNFYNFNPDVIIVCQWLHSLSPLLMEQFYLLQSNIREEEIKRVIGVQFDLLTHIRNHTKVPILVNNFPLPDYTTLGIIDAQDSQYQINTIIELNKELLNMLKKWDDIFIVDFMKVLARVGSAQGVDERYWHIARAPLGRQALLPIGQEYGRYIRALKGKTKKCLVLDCDNTLWGGIIGEVGTSGIQLGATYPGSCYQAFQREVLNLYNRGILLALCSKNNEEDVLEVVRNHPDMILREEHFVTRRINWKDKANNLIDIARELNIGLDSLVFADDSAFEGGLVRDQIADVDVIELSGDPSTFRVQLMRDNYFDTLTLSKEDAVRSKMYLNNKERREMLEASASLEEYLRKLGIVVTIGLANDKTVSRVAQLTQKTNQFNLTTQRYTEGEIRAYSNSPEYDVFFMDMKDTVADLGIIGVAIVKYAERKAEIDTFLLSCRALGRKVEDALLAYIMGEVKKKGFTSIQGRYRSTEKNGQVADFYGRNGFSKITEIEKTAVWEMFFNKNLCVIPNWIKVIEDRSVIDENK